ncbi:hypothetical protein COCON_G00011620 [Conger conger]|uniref:Proteasome assembly chaperone 2 n=1 Tax=Conger conger TaxID=82655 RepID=A0A9Q1E2R3_CONCO|nr:proteasome assembly chaperone 2 [Conger conger]KAJ8288503.1 hypothetical protein COCON_G00011620 [Conger conger]
MFIQIENTSPSFKEFTLVMPAVSVGNVGQLATDLIISTLNMSRVGYFHTGCLIPMVGNNPYAPSADNSTELCTTAEVYASPDLKLAVLQIRSPIIQTKRKPFRKLIISWIKSSGFARTVLLSSSHAYQRDDQQIHSTPLRYLLSPAMQRVVGDALKELDWREMEKLKMFPGLSETEERLYIPGGGITKGLYTDCCSEDVPLAVVLTFCSEGDNIPDAFALVSHLNDWLHLVGKPSDAQWKVPDSWRLLFGNGIPLAIF